MTYKLVSNRIKNRRRNWGKGKQVRKETTVVQTKSDLNPFQ